MCAVFKSFNTSSFRLFASKKDFVPDVKSFSKFYKPKTANQEFYNKCLNDDTIKIVFSVGPAGTGKTLLACNTAIRELKRGKFQKIIITRPVVPVEEDIGFLPGSLLKKMDPWTRPIKDVFLELYSEKEIENMMYGNTIEISPLAYMRGRTFKNAFIIADEMQNSSPNQMLMLMTRIGSGSKMVITGDLNQTDRGLMSGLSDFIKKYNLYDKNKREKCNKTGIEIVELNANDILREPIISTILDIYNADEREKHIYAAAPMSIPLLTSIMDEREYDKNNQDAALMPKKDLFGSEPRS
jgi:phosphate starvation-inducible PhoH-like protein